MFPKSLSSETFSDRFIEGFFSFEETFSSTIAYIWNVECDLHGVRRFLNANFLTTKR